MQAESGICQFDDRDGIDIIGVIRALPYDLTHLSFAQGASTITEQVAKVLYLGGNDHSPWRKLEDAAVAWKLENRHSKAQILAAYLNSAYFGEAAYGVWAASERYFGIPPRRLALPQREPARWPDSSAFALRPLPRSWTRTCSSGGGTAFARAQRVPRRRPGNHHARTPRCACGRE